MHFALNGDHALEILAPNAAISPARFDACNRAYGRDFAIFFNGDALEVGEGVALVGLESHANIVFVFAESIFGCF